MKSTARRRNSRSLDLLLLILAVATGVNGLQNVSVDIPEAVAVGSTVNLTCRYDLQGDVLYAVKWYKGKDEFYRYLPKEMPPISTFGDFKHKIIESRSDAHKVTLVDVTSDLDGKYKCEVTNDLPNFHTLQTSKYMHVAHLPVGGPEVLVEKQRYAVGEIVKANCTTPSGNPPANITWTVNGHLLNSTILKNIQAENDNFSSTYALLEYEITQDSYRNGRVQITCHANVFQLYKRDASIHIDEEKPRLASVLGTRDSPQTTGAVKNKIAQSLIVMLVVNSIQQVLR
ncbi:uncharacterized protein LOC122858991 isoform X2 [Aphidius gifuensis]|uniref:uncharacterized protein LOC122858991 isoform X2 n=1 Tax=Aphidius gifuensis TaxID=684658 RepID=UPI001CDC7BF5|nr:uncharacterized protein LOC122858991 isoform X2 [Aphidius gifuensis]